MEDTTAPTATSAPTFATPDLAAWRARAERELKGTPLDKLTAKLLEGLEVQPLYVDAPRRAPLATRRNGVFRVVARLDGAAGSLAEVVADEVLGGSDGIALALAEGQDPGETLPELLINTSGERDGAQRLLAQAGERAVCWAALDARTGADAALALAQTFGWREGTLLVAADRVHEGGADAATELGVALAQLVAALRYLEQQGIAPRTALQATVVRLAVGSDFLLQIAKLRAWRGLVARVSAVIGVDGSQPLLWAAQSRRALSRFDPWSNLLRGTVAGFGALAGGADVATVEPFDRAARHSDAMARRLARNTLLILRDESHLDAVADPAAGSFALESWTETLAARAWSVFQAIEAAGGDGSTGAETFIAKAVQNAADARGNRIARRQDAIIGTSLYIDADEAPLADAQPTLADGDTRDGAPFDALRLRAMMGHPTIFVANVGPLAEQQARTAWVRDLFHAGGYRCIDEGDGFPDSAAALAAFAAQPTTTAIIAAADARYAEVVPTLAAGLKTAGARCVLVAGRPGPDEAAFRAAGVDDYVYTGLDVTVVLDAALRREGL
jgi:methylmalonyl-CoA mutase